MGRLSLLMTFQHIDVMELLVETGFLVCTHIGRPRLKWLHPQEEALSQCVVICSARWKRGDCYLNFGYGGELHLSLVAVGILIGVAFLRQRVASLFCTRGCISNSAAQRSCVSFRIGRSEVQFKLPWFERGQADGRHLSSPGVKILGGPARLPTSRTHFPPAAIFPALVLGP